mgnify:CR=1 FL=1
MAYRIKFAFSRTIGDAKKSTRTHVENQIRTLTKIFESLASTDFGVIERGTTPVLEDDAAAAVIDISEA